MKKALFITTLFALLCAAATLFACGTPKPSAECNHTFGEWQTTLNSTCGAEGTEIRSCHCGYQETRSLPKIPHTYSTFYNKSRQRAAFVGKGVL